VIVTPHSQQAYLFPALEQHFSWPIRSDYKLMAVLLFPHQVRGQSAFWSAAKPRLFFSSRHVSLSALNDTTAFDHDPPSPLFNRYICPSCLPLHLCPTFVHRSHDVVTPFASPSLRAHKRPQSHAPRRCTLTTDTPSPPTSDPPSHPFLLRFRVRKFHRTGLYTPHLPSLPLRRWRRSMFPFPPPRLGDFYSPTGTTIAGGCRSVHPPFFPSLSH